MLGGTALLFFSYKFLIPLVAAHAIVDFIFQSKEASGNKTKFRVLAWHSIQFGIVSYILLGIIKAWPVALIFGISHLVIDAFKARIKKDTLQVFLFDQVAHFLAIIIISLTFYNLKMYSPPGFWFKVIGMEYYNFLLYMAGLIVSVKMGSILIRLGFKAIDMRPSDITLLKENGSIPDGGKIIGYLERALIYLFVLVGHSEAIGFLIAAKSVFRFGETSGKDQRKEAEYVIIGTLSSFLFGLVVAHTVRYYLSGL